MKYIYRDNIALRSWRWVPHAIYLKNQTMARPIKGEVFDLLRLCDGKHDVPDSDLLRQQLEAGVIHPAAEGETLTPWQEYMHCDNRYFPMMQLTLTGKCNFNCLHCFNAADNAPLMSEWTWDELVPLLDDCRKTGINGFFITGGEPMLHPRFIDAMRAIYDRGMFVITINTNGVFLTQEKLDEMRSFGCVPLMKISFDGKGWHDWLRNRKGAEQKALDSIKLCVDNGFPVCVHANIHRKNVDGIGETMHILADMGVTSLRVLRTTESPRWKQNAPDATLTMDEYYEAAVKLAADYAHTEGMQMDLQIWQYIFMYAKDHSYRLSAVHCTDGEYNERIPVCRRNREMLAVSADGNVYPCSHMSGTLDALGIYMGNVKKDGLQQIMQSGPLLENVCTGVGKIAEANDQCGSCKYFKYCTGGCRCIAVALTKDLMGPDPSKCAFFKHGYYQKTVKALEGWKNLAPVSILEQDHA